MSDTDLCKNGLTEAFWVFQTLMAEAQAKNDNKAFDASLKQQNRVLSELMSIHEQQVTTQLPPEKVEKALTDLKEATEELTKVHKKHEEVGGALQNAPVVLGYATRILEVAVGVFV